MKPRAYSAKTVITAQRRVLRVAGSIIGRMTPRQRAVLYTDGNGLWTLDELFQHITAAANLRVKR